MIRQLNEVLDKAVSSLLPMGMYLEYFVSSFIFHAGPFVARSTLVI